MVPMVDLKLVKTKGTTRISMISDQSTDPFLVSLLTKSFFTARNLSQHYSVELYMKMQMSDSVTLNIKQSLSCQLPGTKSV